MATDYWVVADEDQRLEWSFAPFDYVGPLEFGMTHEQAKAAAHGVLKCTGFGWLSDNEMLADFVLESGFDGIPSMRVVTAYYDQSIGLAGIAINAQRGPQVTWEGMRLVGQVPSRLEEQFWDYATTHNMRLRYSQSADPGALELGLVLRAQRVGDLVLSRPVMVAEAWADRCWDISEGRIPQSEWNTFVE